MIINRIYETQNILSLKLVSFLVGLRTYQHPCMLYKHASSVVQPIDHQPQTMCVCGRNKKFKLKGQDPLETIAKDPKAMVCENTDWIHLAQ
jgi:hypothetical protein